MQSQGQQQYFSQSTQLPPQQNFGAHDMFGAHESLSALTGILEQYTLYEPHIKDPELNGILQQHKAFCTQLYNTIVDTFQTGQNPNVPTQSYKMTLNNTATYGMQPTIPKPPSQSANEINDQCVSGYMLGSLKAASTAFTTTALEMTNPVLRRIFQDSVPNVVEMAYELFLYQNKHHYYQVPQFGQQDMQDFQNCHAKIQNTNGTMMQ